MVSPPIPWYADAGNVMHAKSISLHFDVIISVSVLEIPNGGHQRCSLSLYIESDPTHSIDFGSNLDVRPVSVENISPRYREDSVPNPPRLEGVSRRV